MRLRQTVKGVQCWVLSEAGRWTPGKIDIPNGWYALPFNDDLTTATGLNQ